jgi:aspartate kinase
VGVASERGLVQLGTRSSGLDALRALLAHLEEHQVAGKEIQFRSAGDGSTGHASLVLSRENIHDLDLVVASFGPGAGGVTVREGVGAVSAIGSGINASFASLRRALDAAAALEAAVLGISTSSFRISVLVEERHLEELTRRFHAALVEAR